MCSPLTNHFEALLWAQTLSKETRTKENWEKKWEAGGFHGIVPMGLPTKPWSPWKPSRKPGDVPRVSVSAGKVYDASPPVSPTSPAPRSRDARRLDSHNDTRLGSWPELDLSKQRLHREEPLPHFERVRASRRGTPTPERSKPWVQAEDDGHAARMGLSPGYHGRLSLEQLLVRTGSSPTCRDNLELTWLAPDGSGRIVGALTGQRRGRTRHGVVQPKLTQSQIMHDVRRLAVERRQREAAQRVAYERSETRRPLSVSSGEVLPPLRDMEQPSIGGEDFAALPVERRRTEAEAAEAAATPQEKAEGEAVEECRPLDEIFELLRAKIDQGYHSYRHVFRELGKHDEEKRRDGALTPEGLRKGLAKALSIALNDGEMAAVLEGIAAQHEVGEMTDAKYRTLRAVEDGYVDYNSFALAVKLDRTDFMKDAGTHARDRPRSFLAIPTPKLKKVEP